MDVIEEFQIACEDGNLKLAKKLLQKYPNIDISFNNEYIFRYACYNKRFKLAKWLLKVKPNIDISINNEYAFKSACLNGDLKLAQYLLKVKPDINISVFNDACFVIACYKNHLKLIQWLQSLKPFKYSIEIKTKTIFVKKINKNCEERLLFMLYTLQYKNYTNYLTPNLLTNIRNFL